MDYMSWHIALNAYPNGRTVTPCERRMIFKPSWTCRRWMQAALKGTHSVQLVAPELPLHRAEHVYVRNSETRRHLERMEFTDVEVLRVRVDEKTRMTHGKNYDIASDRAAIKLRTDNTLLIR